MKFNEHGLLPAGDYELTILQLKNSILVNGPRNIPWDTDWRRYLGKQETHFNQKE